MTQTLDAIYSNGTFRPISADKIPLREGQNFRITIEPDIEKMDIIGLAGEVYKGLSEDEIEQVETIALDRREFFGEQK